MKFLNPLKDRQTMTNRLNLVHSLFLEMFHLKKWANKLNRAFSKEKVQMAKKKKNEKMLTILAIKELQIRTSL
jgi:hypothetical protein